MSSKGLSARMYAEDFVQNTTHPLTQTPDSAIDALGKKLLIFYYRAITVLLERTLDTPFH